MLTPRARQEIENQLTKRIQVIKDNFDKERLKAQRQIVGEYLTAYDKRLGKPANENDHLIEDDVVSYVKQCTEELKSRLENEMDSTVSML